MENFNFRQIHTVEMGIFRFKFEGMSAFQTALINTKLNTIADQTKNNMYPVGDFIYFLNKINVLFSLSYKKPDKISDKLAEQLYINEFLPLYIKCVKAGIIKKSND